MGGGGVRSAEKGGDVRGDEPEKAVPKREVAGRRRKVRPKEIGNGGERLGQKPLARHLPRKGEKGHNRPLRGEEPIWEFLKEKKHIS